MACERYPDPVIQILDPRFQKYHLYADAVERLATAMGRGAGVVFVLSKTSFGRSIHAVGISERAVYLSGVNAKLRSRRGTPTW